MGDFAKHLRTRLAPEARNVRVLTLDIESKPLKVYAWGLWDQNVSLQQIIEDGGMMCFAAKWLGDKNVLFYSEYQHGKDAMIKAVWELLSEADVVVTYNGDRYDIKRLNNEFMLTGLTPPKPFKSIDLIKTNKGRFDLPSRKLDYLVQRSGVGAKVKHQGFDLWVDCIAGDPKAWAVMEKYNRGDVLVTERGYLRILPWITNAPHIGMFTGDEHSCPYCGSTKLKRDGTTHTNVQSYRLYECLNCHGWVRGVTKLQEPTRTRATR
jgi:DNA polymerase elongation subunit (family B)/predicted RNA-binding Zn-ribbon protein involved in translation (DUF1610 family)